MMSSPHLDLTINLANIVAAILGVSGLLWKLSGWVTEMRNLVLAFGRHEARDEERFDRIDRDIAALRSEMPTLQYPRTR
jgi:hypothetical protein